MPSISAKGEDRNQTSVYQLETMGLVQLGINPANISINQIRGFCPLLKVGKLPPHCTNEYVYFFAARDLRH